MIKNISILGSTGSIGTQTLEIVRYNRDICVTALAAGGNVSLMEQQIREFKPRLACLWDEKKAKELKLLVRDLDVKVVSGMAGLIASATEPQAGLVVTALVGMIGIRPTIAAMEAGKDIAVANKETLVTAGHLIMPLAARLGVNILPVDSEHSAIFQCLRGNESNPVHKILLTASGGPFRGRTREQMAGVTVEAALKHPNWTMGQKITIDSATLVNKGLEVMEAHWLFGLEVDRVQVVVQPASIIHSMVEYEDGAVMAQLGTPDMKLPIQYALYYPRRRYLPGERLDFTRLCAIAFEKPDLESFKGLKLAYEAGRQGGSMPTVFNAANELAVAMFLRRELGFLDIADAIEEAMDRHKVCREPDIEGILEAEQETYEWLLGRWGKPRAGEKLKQKCIK